jgi:hypothetical protein
LLTRNTNLKNKFENKESSLFNLFKLLEFDFIPISECTYVPIIDNNVKIKRNKLREDQNNKYSNFNSNDKYSKKSENKEKKHKEYDNLNY